MKIILLSLTLASQTLFAAAPLETLSDEFNAPSKQHWKRLYRTEGWKADQLARWAINPRYSKGNMVLAPHTSAWYMDLKGVLVYKDVEGDFEATTKFKVSRRLPRFQLPTRNLSSQEFNKLLPQGAPSRSFSLCGIFVRKPQATKNAAENRQNWKADRENYLFLSYGSANQANQWKYEVKTTRNGNSVLYFNNHGVPKNDKQAAWIMLKIIKVNQTVVTFRKHPGGDWITENRYTLGARDPKQTLPQFSQKLQVGITIYTDWPNIQGRYFSRADQHQNQYEHNKSVIKGDHTRPDIIAQVDYFRFKRPAPAVTEQFLRKLPLSYNSGKAITLSKSQKLILKLK